MIVRLAAGFAFVALAVGALAGATVAPAAQPNVLEHKCSKGFVHAVIAGKHRCLKAGQGCTKRLDRQYHRYGFHCHTGRLTKRAKPKPPPAPKPIGTITARIPLAGGATSVEVGAGAVWVRERGVIQRIDPATNAATASIAVGDGSSLAVGESAVWAPNIDSDTVSRIDPGTNNVVAAIVLRGTDPDAVATGLGAVWVGVDNAEGTPSVIERIDPAANAVVASIADDGAVDIGVGGIAVAPGAVWSGGTPSVTRVDATTNRVVARVGVARGGDMAADAQAVWSASGRGPLFRSGVIRIDPVTNAVAATIPVANTETSGLALGFGSVWATTAPRPGRQGPLVLARIDPSTNTVAGTLPLGEAGDVATGFGAVWVAAGNTLLRIEPAA